MLQNVIYDDDDDIGWRVRLQRKEKRLERNMTSNCTWSKLQGQKSQLPQQLKSKSMFNMNLLIIEWKSDNNVSVSLYVFCIVNTLQFFLTSWRFATVWSYSKVLTWFVWCLLVKQYVINLKKWSLGFKYLQKWSLPNSEFKEMVLFLEIQISSQNFTKFQKWSLLFTNYRNGLCLIVKKQKWSMCFITLQKWSLPNSNFTEMVPVFTKIQKWSLCKRTLPNGPFFIPESGSILNHEISEKRKW